MPNLFARARGGRWLWPGLPLLLVLAGRLWALTAGGALAFPDEERHLKSVEAVEALLQGHFEQACLHLANTQGRPADALLRLPVAAGQVALRHFGHLPPTSPASLLLPQLFGWLVLVLNLALLWRLARRWLSAPTADTVVVVYAALASSQLYVRHLFPYDAALGLVLLALVLLSSPRALVRRGPGRQGVLAGTLGMLAFAVYPGYYFAPLLPGALVLALAGWAQWKRTALGFLAGTVLVVAPLEILTRLGHISYLRTLQHLPATVNQGDFAEGFSFLPHYLWQVEGPAGGLLLLAALPGMRALLTKHATPLTRVVALAPAAAWLGHASLVFFAHQLVFYGRLVHFFLPFLVLYAGTALPLLQPRLLRRAATVLLVGAVWVNLGHFGCAYVALAYPRDVLASYPVLPATPLRYLNEGALGPVLNYRVPPARFLAPPPTPPDSLVLVNFTFLYPLLSPSCQPVAVPLAYHRLLDAPHFLTLPAYGFEGFTPAMRTQLRECNFRCQLYEVRPGSSKILFPTSTWSVAGRPPRRLACPRR